MGLINATLNGTRVLEARLTIPAWGIAYHDVTLDGDVTMSGAVTLVVADLTITASVLTGGPSATGRSFYRLVAGAGGWGKTIAKKSYANDFGVKTSSIVGDAATAVGETLDVTSFTDGGQGPAFVRQAGPASRVLEQLVPNAWYVGEDGKTRLGQRAASSLSARAPRTSQLDLARGTVSLASETIAGILPGIVVDGLEAVDVEHELSAKGGLRSRLWGRRGGGNSRRLAAFRAIFDQLDPDRQFRGVFEYRVVLQEGERLTLQPVRVSTGMPDLQRVYVRPGVPGCKATHTLGSRVLVGFADSSPTNPAVLAFEDADGGGFVPTSLSLAGGGSAIGRVGDSVSVTIDSAAAMKILAPPGAAGGACSVAAPFAVTGTITGGSSKVSSG